MGPLIPGLPDEIARECLARVHHTRFQAVRAVSRTWKNEIDSAQFHHLRKANNLTKPLIALAQAEPVPVPTGPATKYAFTPAYRLVLLEPETGSCLSLPPLPSTPGLPLFCQIARSDRELVVVGGWSPDTWIASNKVFVYDFYSAKWRKGAPLPGRRRSFFACASSVQDRTVFVAGGHDEDKNALKSAWAYDVARDEWVPMPDMARERDECKGVFVAGRFEVVGGYGTESQGQFGKCSETFDVATWRWENTDDDALDSATCPRTCAVGAGGRMYRCRGGKVAMREGKAWRDVVEVPKDAAVAPRLVTWKGDLAVIGSAGHGGPHSCYVVSVEGNVGPWRRVELPEDYSGPIQASCSMEI